MKRCSVCGELFVEGFCVSDGESYYCSEECRRKEMTDEEYNEAYEEDWAYFSTWDDEDEE